MAPRTRLRKRAWIYSVVSPTAGGSLPGSSHSRPVRTSCFPRLALKPPSRSGPRQFVTAGRRGVPPVSLVRLLPAVPEAGVVFDLVEGRVEVAKLVPDALDCGAHVRPITVSPVSSNEAFMVQPVVDRPVCHVPTHVRSQQVDDFIFAKGEAEIGVVPVGPTDIGTQNQLAADHGAAGLQLVRAIGSLDHPLEARGQNV